MDAIEGEDADEFGERIFDLTDNGCSLKVKVEEQGGYPTYVSSRFAAPAAIPGVTADSVKDVYDKVFDLENVFPVKSYEELQTMLNEHYHGIEGGGTPPIETPDTGTASAKVDEDDDISFDDIESTSKTSTEPVDDTKVKESLDSLD